MMSNPSATDVAYSTRLGKMILADVGVALESKRFIALRGKVDLIFTSPPFPLTKAKAYGNKQGQEYLDWLSGLAVQFAELLSPTGSLVVEIGNSWVPGQPSMQTWPLKALLGMQESAEMHLCQTFVCHNTARLPGPTKWVNIDRVRVKDSYTNVWWMANTPNPKADNRKVLTEYSKGMKRLLKTKQYNAGDRPSGYRINSKSFLNENPGAIAPNGINIDPNDPYAVSFLEIANTRSGDNYQKYCKENGYPVHPARMQGLLAEFFVRFLTEPGDLVFDPFAGSNTTGATAERLERRWISTEMSEEYAEGSKGRFIDNESQLEIFDTA